MSVKRFDGWEPTEVHTPEYDQTGRVIRVVVTREAEWDPDEQALMLALHLYRAQTGPCGHYLPDSTAEDAEGRYEVPLPTRCHACTALAQAQAGYEDSDHPRALLFHTVRR